jgi:hypothetical protein
MKAILKQRERDTKEKKTYPFISFCQIDCVLLQFFRWVFSNRVICSFGTLSRRKKKRLLSVGFDAEIRAEVETIS